MQFANIIIVINQIMIFPGDLALMRPYKMNWILTLYNSLSFRVFSIVLSGNNAYGSKNHDWFYSFYSNLNYFYIYLLFIHVSFEKLVFWLNLSRLAREEYKMDFIVRRETSSWSSLNQAG